MPGFTTLSSGLAGFTPSPIEGGNGLATPTLIAQPFFRQLESVSTIIVNAQAGAVLPILEFIENGSVFLWVVAADVIDAGINCRVVWAQRVNAISKRASSTQYSTAALPVGFFVEPNVSVRLRLDNGTTDDIIDTVNFMLGRPERTDPRER